ncbi:MAG: DNA starvation/stationary phase protection protein [Flavobacteriia bacterium]|nr:DNA starvation/stationary phase protection protein [Flavobacteriia bacterium]OJX36899.1 MAG: DNA starvation/stationary phase protection protein [Flavobacteriia bacterium 40-80]
MGKKEKNNIVSRLNELLATYQIHYQNLRSLHWNIKGPHFFELHLKYEELYTRTQVIIDDLAERILTYEAVPLHTFADYVKTSLIKENAYISDGKEGMKYIVEAQKSLLKTEREILAAAGEADDEGTSAFMSDLIREKEKSTWMFSAWLGK